MEEYQNLDSDTYMVTPSASTSYVVFNKSYGTNMVAILTNCSSQPTFFSALQSSTSVSMPSSNTTPVQGKVVPPNAMVSFPIPDDTTVIGVLQDVAGSGKAYVSIQAGGLV